MKKKRELSNATRCEKISWEDIDPAFITGLINLARKEDLFGSGFRRRPAHRGDVTTRALITRSIRGRARLVAREAMTVCGLPMVPFILESYGVTGRFRPSCRDGEHLAPGDSMGKFNGSADRLLTAERVILNFLQRLSGIATQTTLFVQALGKSETRLLDTRKTTPGYRALEKYAVACGGAWNHRLGLNDRVLIKDNHLAARDSGSGKALRDAVLLARKRNPDLLIEVEIDRLDQLPPVMDARPDIVMLDNFKPAGIRKALSMIDGRAATEASGSVSLRTLPGLARLGLDFISCGALVHQSKWVDIGLDWSTK
ncbi:MAG: carboxylating nicotinate-nucleotide diphosphorylase [Verrucomicrobia bacterium]|nr:MAG: carboxylating nicotinate-nucleotide diphosphorylase [Verrucomicrobiota bacterium]